MTLPTDAALLAALEAQLRRLTELLRRLEYARATLVPPRATFWIGSARQAYDSAIDATGGTVDGAVLAMRSTVELTASAVAEVSSRG
ncbi:MAG: hypothetical protein ACKVOG_04410 [Rhodoglobus sp.]